MTSILTNEYIEKLADIVNKYNNTHHSAIKVKSVDVKSSTSIDFGKKNNEKDDKLKAGSHVRISKYNNIFPKGNVANW